MQNAKAVTIYLVKELDAEREYLVTEYFDLAYEHGGIQPSATKGFTDGVTTTIGLSIMTLIIAIFKDSIKGTSNN